MRNSCHGLVKVEVWVTIGVGAWASISFAIAHRVDAREVRVGDIYAMVNDDQGKL